MIQKIGVVGVKPIMFGANRIKENPESKPSYSEVSNDEFVRGFLRENLDDGLGVEYKYADTIGTMQYDDKFQYVDAVLKKKADDKNTSQKQVKKEYSVDESCLRQLGYSYCNSRRKNEVYTGARLISKPNGVEMAKKAGIKTVISIEGIMNEIYSEPVEKAGMKFDTLDNIGNKTLRLFGIIKTQYHEPEILNKLIERPETWMTQDENGNKLKNIDKNIEDVQEFIDILDGKKEEYPLPIYYGCQWGTNRTYVWHLFYDMMKNEDRTKPLSEEKVKKLQEFKKDIEDLFY